MREVEFMLANISRHTFSKIGFDQEAELVWQALGDNCIAVQHIVGSTAVPGLTAKPVIDMIPVVQEDIT